MHFHVPESKFPNSDPHQINNLFEKKPVSITFFLKRKKRGHYISQDFHIHILNLSFLCVFWLLYYSLSARLRQSQSF